MTGTPELLTCEFNVTTPELATPLGRHALRTTNDELNRLLIFHEHPDILRIDFEKTTEENTKRKGKLPMYMPTDIEPNFLCAKTDEGGYQIEATVPFSLKTVQHVGACMATFTIDYPHTPTSMFGRLRIERLARTFMLADDQSKKPIRSPQKTATLALRDFSNTLINFRSGARIEGYAYRWVRIPPLQNN